MALRIASGAAHRTLCDYEPSDLSISAVYPGARRLATKAQVFIKLSGGGVRRGTQPRNPLFVQNPLACVRLPETEHARPEANRAQNNLVFDLLAEDSRRNVYAGELEVRPPGAPTTHTGAMGTRWRNAARGEEVDTGTIARTIAHRSASGCVRSRAAAIAMWRSWRSQTRWSGFAGRCSPARKRTNRILRGARPC